MDPICAKMMCYVLIESDKNFKGSVCFSCVSRVALSNNIIRKRKISYILKSNR